MAKKKKGFLAWLFGGGKAKKSKKKTPPKKATKSSKKKGLFDWFFGLFKRKKKSAIRKIYETTDGYFTQNPQQRKPRHIAVIDQREDDSAVAILKIHTQKGKKGDRFMQTPVLLPKNHKVLTDISIFEDHVIVATKKDGKFKAIFTRDFTPTNDSLTKKEYKTVMENLGSTAQHQETNRRQLQRWKKHFKDEQ